MKVNEFENCYFNVNGIYIFADGAVYEGEFENHEENGHEIYTLASGDVYEGEFENGFQIINLQMVFFMKVS
jgi:hypothetical protein